MTNDLACVRQSHDITLSELSGRELQILLAARGKDTSGPLPELHARLQSSIVPSTRAALAELPLCLFVPRDLEPTLERLAPFIYQDEACLLQVEPYIKMLVYQPALHGFTSINVSKTDFLPYEQASFSLTILELTVVRDELHVLVRGAARAGGLCRMFAGVRETLTN